MCNGQTLEEVIRQITPQPGKIIHGGQKVLKIEKNNTQFFVSQAEVSQFIICMVVFSESGI